MLLTYIVLLKIFFVSCDKQYGSLTFVIDTTGSMSKEIHLVKDAAQDIMNIILSIGTSQIKDVNLVTFTDDTYLDYYKRGRYDYGDPSTKLVLKENKDLTQIQMAFSNLTPKGGGSECEETSLSGIKLGLIESKKNSYMFVFTDAAPKDGHVQVEGAYKKWRLNYTLLAQKIEGVNKLAQSKGNPIFFFLTKHPRYECQQQDFSVYGNIAAATYGQVFTLHNKDDIKKALLFLEELISGSVDILERKVIPAGQLDRVRFTVDDQIKCVFISATAPGFSRSYVDLDINLIYTHLTWTDNNKVLRIDKPAAGTYEAIVKGSKETTVMIFGRTDFEFQHGFSENVPATFRNDRRQPTEGVISFLLINITDPTRSVNIKTVQIVDTVSGKTWYNSTLKKKSKSYYYTEAFAPPPPKTLFIIEVIGEGKTSHKEIKRTSKLPIQSRPKDIDPEISIQGEGTYPYNSDVLLTCKVRAFPAPHIVWKDAEHKELNSSLTQNISEHNYISELHIKLTRSGVYYCQAKANLNNLNENSKSIDLHVMSPFEVHDDLPKESTRVKYGENLSISCGVTSKFPIKITWIKETEGLITESYKYSVISNGKVLLIKKATLESSGRYVCKVFIADDEQTQESRETSVQVIADPVVSIQGSGTYPYHSDVFLTCKVKASPEPRISWKDDNDKLLHSSPKRKIDTFNYVRELHIKKLTRNSIYYCEAQTDLNGTSKRTLNASLHVMSPFEVQDDSSKEPTRVKYGQNLSISCGVTSKFPIKITWIKETEGLITESYKYSVISNGKVLLIKKATLESSGRYICKVFIAGDEQTQESRETSVQVIADPVVSIQGSGTYPYNSDVLLTCKVKASPEPRITWKHDNHSVLYSSLQQKIDTFNYVRKLQVKNLTRNSIYYCEAQTDLNGTSKRTLNASLHVMSPFEVQDNSSKEPTRVKYGQNQAISCGVTSKFPVKITWIKETEGLITDSDKYSVISNGKVLQIKKATLESSGRYICKVFIAGDEQTQESRETSVQVIADPVVSIQGSGTYPYNSDVLLTCKVKASPEPRITWKHDNHSVLYSSLQQKIDTFNYVRKLQVKNLTRNSIYYCEAQTDLNGTSKRTLNASLHVMSPFEVQDNSSKEPTRVKYGQNQAISCGVTSKFPVKITWIKETEGLITDSDKYSVISNGKVLQIKKATLESSGRYICKVFIAGDEQTQESRETSVQVIADPVVSIQGSGTYPYNSDVLLTCKVKASPEPRITWKHDNHSVLYSSLQQKIDTFNYVRKLQVKNLTRNSIYYCEAQTDLNGTSKRTLNASLHVMSPFEVQDNSSKEPTRVKYGQNQAISCGVTSKFPVKITWIKETEGLITDSDKYSVISNGKVLQIKKATLESSGRYICKVFIAGDEQTQESRETSVQVIADPVVSIQGSGTYPYNSDVLLTCKVKASPEPRITWKHDNHSVLYSSLQQKIDTFNYVRKLQVKNLTRNSIYYCEAQTDLNGTSKRTLNASLHVMSPFEVQDNSSKEPTRVKYGQNQAISCGVTSKFPVKITWIKETEGLITDSDKYSVISNGKVLQIKKATLESSGRYICKVFIAGDEQTQESRETSVQVIADPVVSIQGSGTYPYNSDVLLTCKVKASPEPRITWKHDNHSVLYSSLQQKIDTFNYVRKLQVKNLTRNSIYYCEAQTDLNGTSKRTLNASLHVMSPFEVQDNSSKEPTRVKYGQNQAISCGVTSKFPVKITWIKETEGLITDSDKYSVISNGKVLQIKKATLESSGRYICKVFIAGDEQTQESRETSVQVIADPVVSIQGSGTYPYNSDVLLTCKVKASPEPRITWKHDNHSVLYSSLQQKIDTFNYVRQLHIKNLTRNSTYYCEAQTDLNGTSKRTLNTSLHVMSPFEVQDDLSKVSVTAEFESSTVLTCNIKSNFSMKIQWYHVFRNTADILENSDLYMISSDGTEIKVNKVKQENEGRYFCVARLEDDKNTTHQLQRQIRIKHVAPVMGPSDKIYVYEGAPVNLNCNVVKAYPKPGVTWMFKSVESDVFRPMPEGDVLKINATSLSSAGVYKCTAANSEGYNTQETTITVLKKPLSRILVNNKEKEEVFVEYNSTVELACHVISHPPPKVVWNNAREEILHPVRVDPIHNGITSYLKVSPTRKSDVYSCNASNILDNNIKKVKLNVRSPFQVSSSAPAFTSVNYGDNLSINCGVTSKFPLKIIWMNETGALIAESENYSVKSNGEVLQIRKATLHSSGRYICKAFIADDEQTQESRETSVQVFADLPKVEIQPDIVTVFRNLNAVIKCHVTKGFPKPNITWMVMKEKMKNFTVLKEVGPELTVPSAQYHDAGSYKCIATNDIGNDEKTVQLVVKGPSKILSDANKLYMALVGDVSLRIPCATEGFPKPIITWTKGDKTLPADKFYVDIDNTLVIKNPQVEDSGGDYICKAVNSNGTDEKYFETKVLKYIDYDRDDDDIMGNTTYVDILEGTTKQLDCSSRSLKGRWYKSQAPKKGVETSTEAVTKSFIDRKFYSQYGYPLNLWGTLPIENAKSVQDGKYTCRLSDNTGSKSHTYIVNVGNPPVFHDPHDVDINDWQGRKEELSCAVADDMDPKTRTAKAEWTYNGNPSNLANAKITQSHHPIVSWGQYTCTISNIHGSIKKNFNVHSTGCLLPMNTTVNRSSLVLDTSGTWPKLTGDQHFRYIPHNQVVLLSCRSESNSNFFENIPRTSELKAKCNYEDNLLVNGKMYKPSDLQCSAEVAPTIQATGQKCFYENSEIFNLGFDVVQPEPHFLNVFTVCFDKSKNVPIYTKVNVSQTNNIGLDVQKTLWKKFGIYDEKNEEFCEEGSKCCVKPRQLVGQLEVANGPAQLATFIKGLNTVPYWDGCQNIINDNLDEFDRWISLTRHRLSDPYELNSGAFKYVETNGIMVPRYLWKAVWKVVRRVQIPLIYVRVNDPHPKHEDIHCESHCPSILEKHKGPYSYCCTPAEFHKAFDLDVMNI